MQLRHQIPSDDPILGVAVAKLLKFKTIKAGVGQF